MHQNNNIWLEFDQKRGKDNYTYFSSIIIEVSHKCQ